MRVLSSVLSRRKKNPSTISRSRSLASSAERRAVLGGGCNVSKTAPRIVAVTGRARPIVLEAGRTQVQCIADPGLKGA